MKKADMIKELHKAIHQARWEHGFFVGRKSESDTEKQKECKKINEQYACIQEHTLVDLADKFGCSPVFTDWYLNAFDEGKNALSSEEYKLPAELE